MRVGGAAGLVLAAWGVFAASWLAPRVARAEPAAGAESAQPAATQPAATQPAATRPAATQPAATQPAATQPAATQPAATQPPTTRPTAASAPEQPAPASTADRETLSRPSSASDGEAARPRGKLDVLFTADLYGRFAWPGCRERSQVQAELSHLISAVHTVSVQSQLQHGVRPLVLAGGSTMRLDVMGDFIFGHTGDLASRLAMLLSWVGFDALGVGLHDYGARPVAFRNYAEAMHRAGIPLLAGNVSCDKPGDSRCARLVHAGRRGYLVVERGGVRIGIFAVSRGDLARRISKPSSKGLSVADPVEWSRRTLDRLRLRERVDVTIALADLDNEGAAPAEVLGYVRKLGEEAPDLVLASHMYDPGTGSYVEQLRWGHTTIAGTDRFGQHLALATIRYTRNGGKLQVERISLVQRKTRDFEANARAAQVLDQVMSRLCRALDLPLGQTRLARPMRYQDFLDYVLQALRVWGRAEVALLNHGSVADTTFPLDGTLTWEKLYRALRTHTTVGSVSLLGSRLIEVVGPHVGQPTSRLRVLGLERKGEEWHVNGRPVILGERYRVLTTAFVARGGENLIALAPSETFHSSSVTLRGLMSRFFLSGGAARDGNPSVDVEEDFADLRKEWLLHGSADLGFALSNVWIANGANGDRYSQPLLQRDQVTTLTAELKLAAGASMKDHSVDTELQLQYGRTWAEEQRRSVEALDRIFASTIYIWHQIRNTYGQDKWYVPEPFAEGRLTTEFDRPEERSFHYVDFSGTLGAGLTLHPLLFVKLGAVLLASPDLTNSDIDPRPGLYLGYQLRRWLLFQETDHPLDFESRLDLLLTDFTSTQRRELTWQSKASFTLTHFIRVTLTHRLFVFDTVDQAASTANDISLGLSLLFDMRRQTF